METIGREYFENLVARSFFQDFEKDDKGNIVRCKMHYIVHDFAQFLTNNECLIVEDDCENLKTNLSLQKGRHATQFKYLRPMDLRGNDSIVELPREVGEFIHLRYLNLSLCTSLKVLPETICGLCNLQTLGEWSWGLRGLPKGVGRLTSLRTLPIFIVDEVCKIEEMRNLKELGGELQIKRLSRLEDAREAEKAELKNKKHLLHLTLEFGPKKRQIVGMKEVAEALQPHPNLKSLGHSMCLPPLGELPLLESLNIYSLWRVKYVGGEFLGSSSEIAFPRLKHLAFRGMSEWENWEVKEERRKVMPCLLSLEIISSPKLETLPDLLLQRTPPLDLSSRSCDVLQEKWPWLPRQRGCLV
ncbi:putative disease resistance protein RGA4 [Vitis vinifera]|uniref:Putative disease resistance protein RGA4 n=1 Tax=Vitis vinifera TaxID=29760 RepID=A0A438H505_VITVI|nr:putative disease resistance protein RGA4 [Vitis vinifera]